MSTSASPAPCVVFADASGIAAAIERTSRLLGESPAAKVWCFYEHRADGPAEALEQLLALKDRHLAHLSVGVMVPREPDEPDLYSGSLDAAKVQSLASKLFDPAHVGEYIVCGDRALVESVTAGITALGVEPSRIRAEHAGSSVAESNARIENEAVAPGETLVSFVMDGRRRSFTMRTREESILDAAARAGIELPFSCKAGVCSTCRTKLVRGEVDLAENYALEDWELGQGFILACQAHAKTPEIELTYDEI